jgi:SAM-dependent methyltransferase
MLVDIITPLHKSGKRDYSSHLTTDKPECMEVARRFGFDFWDGERKYGYGGYVDDGRWKPVAKQLISKYKLNKKSKILDVGCGKGYLANELPGEIWGCDISEYALKHSPLKNKFKFEVGIDNLDDIDERFDLIISINTLHNLQLPNLKQAIKQINTHSNNAYIVVESYRNTRELHNLTSWALTCEQFHRPEEWEFLFKEWGYKGDYEFIYFS